jgi:putative addiction module killer protein
VINVVRTSVFEHWLDGLRDRLAANRVLRRVDRLAQGNPGDVKPVGEGVSEMRIDAGPGYRVYFIHENDRIIVLLCGGDKGSQRSDIARAKLMAREIRHAD